MRTVNGRSSEKLDLPRTLVRGQRRSVARGLCGSALRRKGLSTRPLHDVAWGYVGPQRVVNSYRYEPSFANGKLTVNEAEEGN